MMRTVRMLLSAALLLSGCGLVESEPGFEIRIGELFPAPVQVPEAVEAGAEFEVVVFTGGGCGVNVERTEVQSLDGLVRITPYDRYEVRDDRVCATVLISLRHAVMVSFPVPGDHEIVLVTREPFTDRVVQDSFNVRVERP